MRPSTILATVLMAGSIPMFAGSAAAAPLSQSKALGNADVSAVEQVQWRRDWRYGDGYYAYGAAPGYTAPAPDYYAYGAAPGYVRPGLGWSGENRGNPDTPSPGSAWECYGKTSDSQSAYPSWECR